MSTNQIEYEQIKEDQLLEQQIQDYISTLTEREKRVMEIAKEHLQSSFCIERSVGFVKWLNTNNDRYFNKK